jgi:hypothetical protein
MLIITGMKDVYVLAGRCYLPEKWIINRVISIKETCMHIKQIHRASKR